MSKKSFYLCGYYFGLPEFPKECKIVNDNSLLTRDVLCSYKNNMHIYWGGQYDPHYEWDSSPQLKKCHLKDRNMIYKKSHTGDYEDIFLLFLTTKQFIGKQPLKTYINGYYEIDQNKIIIDKDYDEPVIYAKKAVLLDISSSVDISDEPNLKQLIRFGFNSETDDGKYAKYLSDIINHMNNQPNKLNDYIEQTKYLDKLFKINEYIPGNYTLCKDCNLENCPLSIRIKKKGKLYDKLPASIANIINEYYKQYYT